MKIPISRALAAFSVLWLTGIAGPAHTQQGGPFRYFSTMDNGVFVHTYVLKCSSDSVSDPLFTAGTMEGPFDDSQSANSHLQQAIDSAKNSGLPVRLSLGRCAEDLTP